MIDFAQARQNMVESQIRPNKVTSQALLEALAHLPREHFVPPHLFPLIYSDNNISLDRGRVLLAPMILSRMVQAAEVTPQDRVLDIACGPGYSTALFARIAAEVTGLESDMEYAHQAQQNLQDLGIINAHIEICPSLKKVSMHSPYDIIFINGMIPEIPSTFFDLLNEGGRIIALVGSSNTMGQVVYVKKTHHMMSRKVLFDGKAPYLKEFMEEQKFVF